VRRGKRIDNNQAEIVKQLRSIPGVTVELDCNDILVGYKGKTYWYEVKNADTVSPKTGKVRPSALKDSQKALLRDWKGHYKVIWSIEQILKEIMG